MNNLYHIKDGKYEFVCKNCRNKFRKNVENGIFCSKSCQISWRNKNQKYNWTEERKLKAAQSNTGKKRTIQQKLNISKSLKSKHSNVIIINYHIENGKYEFICKNCKNVFRKNKKIGIFCSKSCQISYRNSNGNIKHTENWKKNSKERRLNEIKKYSGYLSIGKNEKKLLDEQEITDNCIIDRNFKIIGYKPDGYCYETNTVYEVYELWHKNQINHDSKRQKEIKEHLKCKFIIIKDNW